MKRLVEIRNQEFLCRERALRDSERKIFWLAKAEAWERYALNEIAFHFRECNLDMVVFQAATHYRSDTQSLVAASALNAERDEGAPVQLSWPPPAKRAFRFQTGGANALMSSFRPGNGLPDFSAAVGALVDEIDLRHAPMGLDLPHEHRQ